MNVRCFCGHENHVEMPFDDPSTVTIACTSSCRAARQSKLESAFRQTDSRLSESMTPSQLQPKPCGMLGH